MSATNHRARIKKLVYSVVWIPASVPLWDCTLLAPVIGAASYDVGSACCSFYTWKVMLEPQNGRADNGYRLPRLSLC